MLNLLFLVETSLLSAPVLYLSRYIIAHRADYYQLLLKVTTEAAWEEWILYMLRAVRETARLDHGQNQRDPRPACRHRGDGPARCAADLLSRAGRAYLRAALLPDRQPSRGRHRATSVRIGVPEASLRDRRAGGAEGGSGEAVHQPGVTSDLNPAGALTATARLRRRCGVTVASRPRSRAAAWRELPRRTRCSPRPPR